MSKLKNLLVQVLDDSEKIFALDLLEKNAEATSSQFYVRGYGKEKDIESLKQKGLIVEVMKDKIDLAPWLASGKSEESEESDADFLSSVDTNSPLNDLASGQDEVCIIQLRGPMRDAWQKKLAEYGVELINYKPDYAYKARLTKRPLIDIEALDFVAKTEPLKAAQRYEKIQEQMRKAATINNITQAEDRARQIDNRNAPRKQRGEKGNFSNLIEFNLHVESQVFSVGSDDVIEIDSEEINDNLKHSSAEAGAMQTFDLKCHLPEQIPVIAEKLREDERASDVQEGKLKVRFTCLIKSTIIKELASMTSVVSKVEPFVGYTLANDFARDGIGLEKIDNPRPLLPWSGKGVVVGVADTGIDQNHPDFKDKLFSVVQRDDSVEPNDSEGHGTHVCGIIAGSGAASNGKLRGIASDAKLFVQELLDADGKLRLPLNLADLFQEAYDKGVRIHNNSWGVVSDGIYTIDSHEVDEFVYNHPDFLVVFAAGNEGRQFDVNTPNPIENGGILYNSLRNPALAKNVLTVGACCSPRNDGPYQGKKWKDYPNGKYPFKFPVINEDPICGDVEYLAAFSSRGPSDDERIKPDLVAPGTVIASTRSENSAKGKLYNGFDGKYMYLSGTSQAAPVVAGAAAIICEYYAEEHNHKPSAALIKATIINGATLIKGLGAEDNSIGTPNFHQGFGRLNLANTLPSPDDDEFRLLFVDVGKDDDDALNKSIDERAAWKNRVQVKPGKPFRLTLAWTDRPGHGLQQNLDLVVTTPSGKRIVGNSSMQRGSWEPTDRQNNIEQILFAENEVKEGVYTIYVLAVNTWIENQGFSLVVTGNLKSEFLP